MTLSLDYAGLRRVLGETRPPLDHAPSGYDPNSVCLLLFERGEPMVLAIQKADSDGYHWADHVALPGGRIEPSDRDAASAALRELHEELGIAAAAVEVLGELGHFLTETSDHDLAVLVGRWRSPVDVRPDPREIARVLEICLGDLLECHTANAFRGRSAREIGDALVYPVAGARVWGVTARILHYFIELLLDHESKTLRPNGSHTEPRP